MAKYRLIVRNMDNGDIFSLPLVKKERENAPLESSLSYIDSLTTCFNDKNQLIEILNERNYINFKNAEFCIVYVHNNQYHYLDVIYKDNANIPKSVDKRNDYKVDVTLDPFIEEFDLLRQEFNDEEIIKYVCRSGKINTHLRDVIIQLYNSKDSIFEYNTSLNRLKNELKESYKLFRDLKLVINNYYKKTISNLSEEEALKIYMKTHNFNSLQEAKYYYDIGYDKEEFLTEEEQASQYNYHKRP